MYISSIRIRNYKSFFDSGTLVFGLGFNIVVGQNNAGKTALLERLSLGTADNPHRSITTLPARNTVIDPASLLEFEISLAKSELREFLSANPGLKFHWPLSTKHGAQAAIFSDYFNRWLSRDEQISFGLALSSSNQAVHIHSKVVNYSFGLFTHSSDADLSTTQYYVATISDNGTLASFELADSRYHTVKFSIYETLAFKYIRSVQSKIYRFTAERLNIGTSPITTETSLYGNASNLPSVLLNLATSNPHLFDVYNGLVTDVLPGVKYVTPVVSENNNSLIKVWSVPKDTQRDDLAIPLSDSGTGVSQVLAILYVVVTAHEPKIIIIDEPQSFLHPGAVKKLIEILKTRYPQHQYIVSTHSPSTITTTDPFTILMLENSTGDTSVSALNKREVNDFKSMLRILGVSLSDIFGADYVMWVEGETEEACFPIIIDKLTDTKLGSTAIVSIKNTGDILGKQVDLVFEIYTKMSNGQTIFPQAIAFQLDQENLTQQKQDDLNRRSKGRLYFLKRRMYENYLLNEKCLDAFLLGHAGLRTPRTADDSVSNWMKDHRSDQAFYTRESIKDGVNNDEESWYIHVDGAKLLKSLFQHFFEDLLPYDKVAHSVELTEWLCRYAPESLAEVVDLLKQMTSKIPVSLE